MQSGRKHAGVTLPKKNISIPSDPEVLNDSVLGDRSESFGIDLSKCAMLSFGASASPQNARKLNKNGTKYHRKPIVFGCFQLKTKFFGMITFMRGFGATGRAKTNTERLKPLN